MSCLIIIDVQKGFINQWTGHVPARVQARQDEFERVIVTRFVNPPGSPHRRLLGWPQFAADSADVELAFAPREGARIMDKSTYTCAAGDFVTELKQKGVERVHLCGIATDTCVLKSAVDLFEAGLEPLILATDCASHGGPECHAAGLLLLARFIGADRVIED